MTPIVWATQDSSELLQLASPENMARWRDRLGSLPLITLPNVTTVPLSLV
jgi:hypothetical protein